MLAFVHVFIEATIRIAVTIFSAFATLADFSNDWTVSSADVLGTDVGIAVGAVIAFAATANFVLAISRIRILSAREIEASFRIAMKVQTT